MAEIDGDSGNNHLKGSGEADRIFGRGGHDRLLGRGGDDELNGGAGFDHLHGGNGNDILAGGTDGDLLWGDRGNDTLRGGDGNDVLTGGRGRDLLNGGAGQDGFSFSGVQSPDGVSGRDVVEDFTDGEDQLEFFGFGAAFDEDAEIIAAASQSGAHTVIRLGDQATVWLLNYDVDNLDGGDITFGAGIAT